MRGFQRYGLYSAWLLACIGALTSLYFSDIKLLEPCHLCWYQRTCLFPLTLLLGIGAYRGFLGMALYTLPLTILGLGLALYQVAIQEIPGWNPIDICGAGPSCTERIVLFGPFTIPMASAFLFLTLSVLLALILKTSWKQSKNPSQTSDF